MNIQNAFIVLIAALTGSAFFLHQQNRELERTFAADVAQCEQEIALLESRYQEKIDALRQTLPLQLQPASVTTTPEKKTYLTKLVSHGHRVRAVVHKYEFLLETAQLDNAEKKRLRRLLLKREQLANSLDLIADGYQSGGGEDSSTLQKQMTKVENDIQAMLGDPVDYSRYEFLRQRSL